MQGYLRESVRPVPELTGVPKVKVAPDGAWRPVAPQSSLLGALISQRIAVNTVCGKGICGSDLVLIEAGAEYLSPKSVNEAATLEDMEAPHNARLACSARVMSGEVVLSVPAESLRGADGKSRLAER